MRTALRLTITPTHLKVTESVFGQDISFGSYWTKKTQWVYVYIYSDEENNERGFGAYVDGDPEENFESKKNGWYDIGQHASD